MKTYTTIPNIIASKLSSADTYRYTCLSFTPRKFGYTDSTFKQIGELNSNEPESERTIENFVQRLKTSNLIKIDSLYIKGKSRNRYYLTETETNFKMIKNNILDANIPVEIKGFLIQLFTLTINNTLEIQYSLNKICSLIKISKPTAQKYLKELELLQLVFRTVDGILLSDTYFKITTTKEKEIQQVIKTVTGCEYLEDRIAKTDFDSILYPTSYLNSMMAGVISKKAPKESAEVQNELIYI